jgi:hypothetical protein
MYIFLALLLSQHAVKAPIGAAFQYSEQGNSDVGETLACAQQPPSGRMK